MEFLPEGRSKHASQESPPLSPWPAIHVFVPLIHIH